MQRSVSLFGVIIVGFFASQAGAGITVTSYQTVAGTNAFAPLSRAQYFQQQLLTDVSPAVADATGDWIGTNADGTTPTWHWIGAAHASTTTSFDSNRLDITADGSFAWDISTTSDFYDPGRVETLYVPGAASDYQCYFTVDVPAMYTIGASLGRSGSLFLSSLATGTIFQRVNTGSSQISVTTDGAIPAGQYEIRVNASLGGIGFIQGVNHETESGSFSNFSFAVQVPEPLSTSTPAIAILLLTSRRHKRN